jgi:hypothetical protein
VKKYIEIQVNQNKSPQTISNEIFNKPLLIKTHKISNKFYKKMTRVEAKKAKSNVSINYRPNKKLRSEIINNNLFVQRRKIQPYIANTQKLYRVDLRKYAYNKSGFKKFTKKDNTFQKIHSNTDIWNFHRVPSKLRIIKKENMNTLQYI